MSNLVFRAMEFAREVHKDQVRKYSGNPYVDHLTEVAGITASVLAGGTELHEVMLATAWLHDCVEDQGVTKSTLIEQFGERVADGVMWLSDLEEGNRTNRKALSRRRLMQAPEWVQTIKCADLISNTSSIAMHDPVFAELYLDEKRMLLEVMDGADDRLRQIAMKQSASFLP